MSENVASPTIEFDFGGGPKRFATQQHLQDWLDEQTAAFRWIEEARGQIDSPSTRQLHNRYEWFFGQVRSVILEWPQLFNANQLQSRFNGVMETTANQGGIVTTDSPYFDLVESIRNDGDALGGVLGASQAATSALYSILGEGSQHLIQPGTFERSAAWAGVVALHSAKAIERAVVTETLRSRIQRVVAEGRKTISDRQTELDDLVKRQNELLQQSKEEISHQTGNFSGEVAAAISKLEQVEAAFRTQMKLQAPVAYWTQKGVDHRRSAKTYRERLAWFTIPTILGLALIYVLGFQVLATGSAGSIQLIPKGSLSDSKSLHLMFYVTGFLAILTTLVLWVFRVVIRLYMSHTHLGVDAEERAVMVNTFLALQADGHINEAEKALVLPPLFRPSSDGIVKDDAAPVFSGPALLAALLDGKPR